MNDGQMANVAKYDRTQAEIDELEAKVDAFVLAMTKPEEVTNTLGKATKDVGDGIDGMNALARDTDKYAKAYADKHPGFVADYLKAREK